MYKVLVVDDEPLVQVGLRSMLQGMEDIEVIGAASNGKDALDIIVAELPEIVIADIKMPVMTGLELLEKCSRSFGAVPAFIMLTAYEEFDMVRKALSCQAVDYLIKIELNKENLGEALRKAIDRVSHIKKDQETVSDKSARNADTVQLEELRQHFMMNLLNREFESEASLEHEAANVQMDFNFNRYIVAFAEIVSGTAGNVTGAAPVQASAAAEVSRYDAGHLITLYRSCLTMTREIVERYAPCYLVSNDTEHFTILFFFTENTPVAESMEHIQEALENARTMINNYFNVNLYFGIGTAVSSPVDIHTSFEEAEAAEKETDKDSPIKLFSHLAGANRRSGKDKLISAIQDYIDKNLGGKLQLNEIADAFGLSPAYLSVLFKKNTDVGFSEYVYTRKIEEAKRMLLSDDMKVYEVADALGFESAFYFSKVFKKVVGVSPREFIQAKTEGE